MYSEPMIRTVVGIALATVVSFLSFVGTITFTVLAVSLCATLVCFVAICSIVDQSFRVAKLVYHEMRWGPDKREY